MNRLFTLILMGIVLAAAGVSCAGKQSHGPAAEASATGAASEGGPITVAEALALEAAQAATTQPAQAETAAPSPAPVELTASVKPTLLASANVANDASEAPATQPALPAGHPPIKPQLPAGHPPMPAAGAGAGMPAGHPDISKMGGAGGAGGGGMGAGGQGMPSGHPDISQMGGAGGAGGMGGAGMGLPSGHPAISPATQPATGPGVLTIHATQKTPGGPAVGGETVKVTLYNMRGIVVKEGTGQLDEKGSLVIRDLPVAGGVQTLVVVNHAGVDYEAVADDMTEQKPAAEVEVPVFETTEQAPAWQVQMRHVLLTPVEGGVQVEEMIIVNNPADRAWLGQKSADGARSTIVVPLPKGASDLEMGAGFRQASCRIVENKLISSLPLPPGGSRYQLIYFIPVRDGKATLTVSAPAPVGRMMVAVPDDGSQLASNQLTPLPAGMGDKSMHMYQAMNLKPGQEVGMTLTVGTGKPGSAAEHGAGPTSLAMPKMVAAVGGVLILVVGLGFVLVRSLKAVARQ